MFKSIIPLFLLAVSLASAQIDTVYPCIGFPNQGIIIGTSTFGDVLEHFGPGYTLDSAEDHGRIHYENLGITFNYNATNRYQIITSIELHATHRFITPEGFVTGRSTVDDGFRIYANRKYNPRGYEYDMFGEGIEIRVATGSSPTLVVPIIKLTGGGIEDGYEDFPYLYNSAPEDSAVNRFVGLLASDGMTLETLWGEYGVSTSRGGNLDRIMDKRLYVPVITNRKSVNIAGTFAIHHIIFRAGHENLVSIITEGKTIIRATISKKAWYSNRVGGDSVIRTITINPSGFRRMMRSYEQETGVMFDTTDDIAFPYGDKIIFAASFGDPGGPPMVCCIMCNLVELHDTATMRKWLRSKVREVSAYGAVGLKILESMNIPIRKSDGTIIAALAVSRDSIFAAGGCTTMKIPMSETIS
ncbi:MAG: hypothetical protein ABI876_16215, partial [Bacteroidota bacterium]